MRGLVITVIIVVVLLVLSLGAAFWFLTVQLSAVAESGDAVTMTVSQGESVDAIAEDLKDSGLIRNPLAFKVYVWGEDLSSKLQAGEYLLKPSMDVPEIVRILTVGDTLSREATVRILEGWSNAAIGAYLVNDQKLFSAADWQKAASTTDSRALLPEKSYSFFGDKPVAATLEGYLYPDTYRVFRDTEPAALIEKMLDNFEKKVTPELREEIRAQGKTLFDVLTLASIVEREVRTDSDRKMAADVFYKRLRDGIPLQSDATVNYVTGKSALQPTLDDTAVDSPYNTYRYPGLPPGPIGNPGIVSILAVVRPEPNPYYYFLTAPSGETIFSKTFEEHTANKAKYLSP